MTGNGDSYGGCAGTSSSGMWRSTNASEEDRGGGERMKITGFALASAVAIGLVLLLSSASMAPISANGIAILAGSEASSQPAGSISTTSTPSGPDASSADSLGRVLQSEYVDQYSWEWASEGAEMPYSYEYYSSDGYEEKYRGILGDGHRDADRTLPSRL